MGVCSFWGVSLTVWGLGRQRAPVHDRGKVLVHALLMLAGGGEACSYIEHLRAQPVLFGQVASNSCNAAGPGPRGGAVLAAVASVRGAVWERRGDTAGSAAVVLDIDSTLVEVHSENKAGAAAHFKRVRVPSDAVRHLRRRAAVDHAAARQRRGQQHRGPHRRARRGCGTAP